ncbi:MAG: metallophosphoesterase, partial [Candidatus Thermoplasmatota archaeon]|nr:metallophosphoesterase [Candidatus Thermoplasmatota archaeon]
MRIAHISDIHCHKGSDFNPEMFTKSTRRLNKYDVDLVFVSGDLTTMGLLVEYEMAEKKLEEKT